MKKRIISFLMALALIVTLFSPIVTEVNAYDLDLDGSTESIFHADCGSGYDGEGICSVCGIVGGVCRDGLMWIVNTGNGVLTISGDGSMLDYASVYSNVYDSTVTTAPWIEYASYVQSIVIEEGVTSICDYAFGSSGYAVFSNVKSVTLPNSLESIGMYAFSACNISEIVVPGNVESIGEYAFGGASKKTVTFTGDAPNFGGNSFFSDVNTYYYPCNNETWTEKLQSAAGLKQNWFALHDAENGACTVCRKTVYTVVFKNWDGTVLSTNIYCYGDKVTAPPNPTKVADKTYTYAFAGWDKEVVNCAGDAVYIATYIISGSHTHNYSSSKVTDPTCTVPGYTTYSCACGSYYNGNSVAATGHSFGSYVSDNNGSADSEGTKTRTCSKCGDHETVNDAGVRLPNVEISSTQGHLTGNILRWDAVEGADLYQIFRLNNGTWELLANTRGLAYKDETAPEGAKSYYKVRARNGNLMSSMAVASTAVTRPAPVTSLANVTITSITAHTTGNIIYWDAVPNALLYQVYRLNGSSWELLKNTGATAYKDETAPVGVKAYYKIVARRDSLKSNIGTTASASATRPSPITSLNTVTITGITAHKTGNIIYWDAVPNALLYQVYRLNGSSWELLKNTGGTAYKDETAPVGVRSYYKIVARRDSLASNIRTTVSASAVRPRY